MVINMKKTLLFLLVILFVIGACGCMRFNKSTTLEEQMVQQINEKYTDDKFTYKAPFGGGAGADSKKIIVSSEKYPDEDIFVVYSESGYADNYLSVKYQQQTEKLIRDTVDSVLECDYLLFYESDMSACPNPDGVLSFDEFIEKKESGISFTVVAKEMVSDKEIFENEIKKAIICAGICCTGTIYFDNNSGEYDSLDFEKLSGYLFRDLYQDVCVFVMDNNESFKSLSWGDV